VKLGALGAAFALLLGGAAGAQAQAPSVYGLEVARDAPRAHWRLGETSGTTALDALGVAPGVYQGGVALGAPGAIVSELDSAAHFDGSDDRVNMGDPASGLLDFGAGDLTIELWSRSSVNREQALISKGGTGRHWIVTLTDDPGRTGQIRTKLSEGTVTRQAYGPPVRVDDGNWHHVVVVFGRDAGITVYVDGRGQFTAGVMPGDVSNTVELLVGKASGYPYFRGDLDEAAIYPVALPADRVLAHHDAGRGGIPVDITPPETTLTSNSTCTSSEPGSTFECRVDGGPWAPSTSPADHSGLPDGSHTFEVRATDPVGNTDPTPASRTWTIDTTPPETTVFSGPAPLERTSAAAVSFGSEAGATFECRLDGGAWAACSSPADLSGLPDGTHTFAVPATDAAGNTDPTPASRTWTIDTTPPDTAIVSGPGGTTASTSASFELHSENGASFECRLDGSAWGGCSALSGLGDGAHTLEARAVDPAGNADPTPASRTWTVDTTPPETELLSGPASLERSSSATLSFGSEVGASFECRLDDGAWAACSSPADVSGLADGAHQFQVRATDVAGNTDLTPASRTWTVDTVPAETSIDSGPAALTAATSASLAFSSEPGASFECRLDADAWVACSSPAQLDGLADGAHTFAVRATDTAGNQDPSPAAHSWTVSTQPPETAIDTGPEGTITVASATLAFSSATAASFECRLDDAPWAACESPAQLTGLANGPHVFEVRAIDALGFGDASPASRSWTVDVAAPDTTITSGPSGTTGPSSTLTFESTDTDAAFECRLDTGAWETCSSPHTLAGLPDGPHTAEVRAVGDPTPASRTWTVDATPPDTRVTGGPPAWTNQTTVTVFFTSTEKGITFDCRVNGSEWQRCTSPRAISGLTDGPQLFEVRAADAYGNLDATPATRSWTVDTVPPETAIDEGPSGIVTTRSATFHFTSTQAYRFECRLDGAAWAICPSRVSYANLQDGSHTFEVRSRDPAGNIDPSPASRTWIIDATPPETLLTAGPEGTTTTRSASFEFSTSEADATLECRLDGSDWTLCTSPKAYGGMVEGEHTFEVRGVDAAGGVDVTPATRTWTIDADPPPAAESNLPSPLPESTGTVFHVATTGSNTNPGTEELPWRTVQKAVDVLAPGQKAIVHAGTYTQRVDVNRACSASAPCTIEAAPGEERPSPTARTSRATTTSWPATSSTTTRSASGSRSTTSACAPSSSTTRSPTTAGRASSPAGPACGAS